MWYFIHFFSFCKNKYEVTTIRDEKKNLHSMILRTFPTATVRPSSRNVNRPSWGKRLNGSIQIAWPDWDNSNLAIATWSCFINLGCSWVLSPVLRSISVINFFNWTSATAAWIWRTAE